MKIFSKFKSKFSRAGSEIASAANIFYCILVNGRTPWYVKGLCLFGLSYIFSPLDIIPDFIPLAGYIDDFLIVPAVFYFARKLTPGDIYGEAVLKANDFKIRNKKLFEIFGAFLTLIFLLGVAVLLAFVFLRLLKGHKKL